MQTASGICQELLSFYPDEAKLALGLEVAETLHDLSMHESVVRVGFIGRLRHEPNGLPDELILLLSDAEKTLLADLDKISVIDVLHENSQQDIELLRQMLLAIANDVRVVVIKLALQLVAMRHLYLYDDNKKNHLALQTRDIQAPLANRLGIAKLKWELEDLALRELEPTTYRLIATSLVEERKQRVDYVNDVVNTLTNSIVAESIDCPEVYGRAKHINSIFNKMKKKNKRLEEIYDLLAIRVQVDTLKDCYTVLGIVHSMWKHIPSEFDDYVASPKPNGYQSLHTAVIGPEDKTIEVQIRTHEMHEYAELGVAAHWRYKEDNTGQVTAFDQQISWLRSLLAEPDEAIAGEFAAQITEDRVYVITPQGKVIDLPNGSTPLDFAYSIHTDLGHRTKGAKVNGALVPFTYHLKTGDTVEVISRKKPNPSRDWINSHAHYLQSTKAKAKVRHFFKQLERDKAIEEGEELLEKQLDKVQAEFTSKDYSKAIDKAVEKFNFKTADDLYAALGFGDVGVITVVHYLTSLTSNNQSELESLQTRIARIPIRPAKPKNNVMIEGIDDLLISMASCCNPVAPEEITGFITKTKGISIHKSDCPNVCHLADEEPEKIMSVNWSANHGSFSANIHLRASDRVNLIRDVTQLLSNEGITIQKANFSHGSDSNITMQLEVTVRDVENLTKALHKITLIRGVNSAVRMENMS